MRLTSVAVGILALGLAGYPAIGTIMARAAAPQRTPAASGQGAAGSDLNASRSFARQSSAQQSSAQQADQSKQDQIPTAQQTLKVGTQVVNVFATVRDKKHAIVNGLTQDDFKVYEDGVEQKVSFYSKEMNLPITLAILIDTSGSQTEILGAEQDTASRFVKEIMRKKDEAIVISFDFDINLLADFTEDTAVLERAIRHAEINAVSSGGVVTPGTLPQGQNGGTDLYDAVYLACHDELASEAGRKAVVVLTDAEDTGSKLSLQESIESAQRSDTVVHILLLSDEPFYYRMGMGYSGEGVANKMTGETGGRMIVVRNERTLEKAFDEIAEELRSQYVLGYYPTNDKRDGTFRKIKVEVKNSDMKVLARRGYYAPTH
jgi:VWFA-related protein